MVDARIEGQQFGIANDSANVPLGILGLGPPTGSYESKYPLVLDNLADQGHIESRAFSVDLRNADDDEGMGLVTLSMILS